jgi:hypothetical protein
MILQVYGSIRIRSEKVGQQTLVELFCHQFNNRLMEASQPETRKMNQGFVYETTSISHVIFLPRSRTGLARFKSVTKDKLHLLLWFSVLTNSINNSIPTTTMGKRGAEDQLTKDDVEGGRGGRDDSDDVCGLVYHCDSCSADPFPQENNVAKDAPKEVIAARQCVQSISGFPSSATDGWMFIFIGFAGSQRGR